MELTDDRMYQAILDKDASFEGVFYTAVKTTGIFCRPSCTARKPKRENVVFYPTALECLQHGYRACKTCRPLENRVETPENIRTLLRELSDEPAIRLRDQDLRDRGHEPATLRRWFLKHHGLTFHAYQRLNRLNSAFRKLRDGESVTATAFDAGFESLSGFQDSFKSVFGVTPSKSREQRVICLQRLETPLGTMIACAVDEGVCLLEFAERRMLETEFRQLCRTLNATIIQAEHPHFQSLEEELKEYFAGKRKVFTVPLFTPGTEFQQAVWAELQQIPLGTTRSYKQQAIALGRPNAVRAVAQANGMNRISILIPCHRVIGDNGDLTGYGGGVWRKQKLLEWEGVRSGELF